MFKRILLLIAATCGMGTVELTLQQTIHHAQEKSPDAQSARHSFRSSYWNYRYYRANYLPNLTLTSNPYLDRAINKVTMGDGSVKFVEGTEFARHRPHPEPDAKCTLDRRYLLRGNLGPAHRSLQRR